MKGRLPMPNDASARRFQVSGFRGAPGHGVCEPDFPRMAGVIRGGHARGKVQEEKVKEKSYLAVEDLDVYRRLCQLHLEVCDLTHLWPAEERYELGSQVRRSSNSAPCQLAEKNDDRHVRNKIEGVNRSRGEAGETIHHLYIALMKKYLSPADFQGYRERYQSCIRMLNGLEKTLEKKLPAHERRWHVAEDPAPYALEMESAPAGWPPPDTRHPTPDTRHLNPPETSCIPGETNRDFPSAQPGGEA